jgi:hypothetical protein
MEGSGRELCYGSTVTCIPIARQQLGKHIPATRARENRASIAR